MLNITEEDLILQRIEIGKNLKGLREARGWSQDQLGAMIGMDKGAVSRVEAGKWNYGINTLLLFARALNMDLKLVNKR
jgi:transcriptional regulator with XRE-family HTH domain